MVPLPPPPPPHAATGSDYIAIVVSVISRLRNIYVTNITLYQHPYLYFSENMNSLPNDDFGF